MAKRGIPHGENLAHLCTTGEEQKELSNSRPIMEQSTYRNEETIPGWLLEALKQPEDLMPVFMVGEQEQIALNARYEHVSHFDWEDRYSQLEADVRSYANMLSVSERHDFLKHFKMI